MSELLHDAHLHLQDERLGGMAPAASGWSVVNATSPDDWGDVLELARAYPSRVIASLGLHPWWVNQQETDAWHYRLRDLIASHPHAGIGEIGLDRWICDHDLPRQEAAFRKQIALAREFNRPMSVHCLKAWGRMLDILRDETLPACGFLLHSYGGPKEMVKDFADLGAWFSFSGYYLLERKQDRREVLRSLPPERVLVETDAPDMPLPEDLRKFVLPGNPNANHPAHIGTIYAAVAEILGVSLRKLSEEIDTNFHRLFGNLVRD